MKVGFCSCLFGLQAAAGCFGYFVADGDPYITILSAALVVLMFFYFMDLAASIVLAAVSYVMSVYAPYFLVLIILNVLTLLWHKFIYEGAAFREANPGTG